MTWEQYWYGDPLMVRYYREMDRLKKEQENTSLWIQGRYFYDGICVALSNAFGKKGAKPAEYPNEPYDLYPRKKTEAEIQAEIEAERQRAYEYLDSVVKAFKLRKQPTETKEPK